MAPIVALTVHVAAAAAASVTLLIAYRWMRRHTPAASVVYVIGVAVRVALGLGLAFSWLLTASPAQRLQPDSRWFPDAQAYFAAAESAAEHGLASVGAGEASPAFVRALALFMDATGVTHASAHLFNLMVYTVTCLALVAIGAYRPGPVGQRAALITVASVAFSPNLILLASQPLKDTLFVGALVILVAGLWWMIADGPDAGLELAPVPLTMAVFGLYLIAGMRAYYGLLILDVVAGALALRWVWAVAATRTRHLAFAGRAAVLLLLLWSGCRLGGGLYYEALVDPVTAELAGRATPLLVAARRAIGLGAPPLAAPARTVRMPAGVMATVERSRRGFELTGGATNMVASEIARRGRVGITDHLAGLALGVAAIFVPIQLLRAMGLVSFPGGGSMLAVTDLDTVFLDLALAVSLGFVWRRRHELRRHWTLTIVMLALGVGTTLLLGYVVTNYGTLFRLRLMAVVPLWLLPLSLARHPADASADLAPTGRPNAY